MRLFYTRNENHDRRAVILDEFPFGDTGKPNFVIIFVLHHGDENRCDHLSMRATNLALAPAWVCHTAMLP